MTKALTVYKASAGSGKTFTLATQYISLVVENPLNYRNILAVTFTNKATEEMKVRILSQLYGIANALPDSESYLSVIRKNTGMGDKMIRERAGIALKYLIHNYNYFRVETIDTFFQSVLRNLARELDLTANLRIGLNDTQIEEQAVDELIESLDTSNKLLGWIMEYIRENIDDDKSWNVIKQIKSFGQNIFKDFYKDHSKQLNEVMKDENFFKSYTSEMRKIKANAKEQLDQLAATFFDALEQSGLTVADYQYGSGGVCGYFIKLSRGIYDSDELLKSRVQAGIGNPDKWVKKADAKPGKPAYDLACEMLVPLLDTCESVRPKLAKAYKSADVTLRHLNQLRLLQSIEQKVRSMNETANRFLLSDTQTLLHSLVKDSDSPFIFEKIGTQLDHIMIDEFQDTSNVQWKNFKVLLEDTMSRSEDSSEDRSIINNMLVGDVKQSIYRWRSGDWRLLNDIEKQFVNTNDRLNIESLDTNRRSDRNIIEFNNAFFVEAAEAEYQGLVDNNKEEAEQVKKAYDDVCQQVPEGKPDTGLVNIRLLPAENYHDEMMELTMDTVDQILAEGIPEKKIAILVRNNHTIQEIADYFMVNRPNIYLVSDEAFRLNTSKSVLAIINTLKLIVNHDDMLAEAYLSKAESLELISIPKGYLKTKNLDELALMPLFDLVERIFKDLDLEKQRAESAYVCAFYDQLSSYLQDNTTDIRNFLKEWDESIQGKTIQSDEIDGIRLITIHKSKGLEFDNVVMPFCDWQLEKTAPIWCVPNEAPFNQLPLVPVDFNAKQMKGTIYEADYYHEHLQNVVDNLNLLYVAFTRAGKNLFVFGKKDKANTRSYIIQQTIEAVSKKLNGEIVYNGDTEDEKKQEIEFTYGTLDVSTEEKKAESTNVFLTSEESEAIEIKNFDQRAQFRQSNKSRDFIEGDDDEEQQKHYIKMGIVLHNLFSSIRTIDDLPQALRQLEIDGVLYDSNVTPDKIKSMLEKRFENAQVKDWFSHKWKLYNECTILHINAQGETEERRPDRVMTDGNEMIVVDFKFGKPKDEHKAQVKEYMDLISSMGHQNIKGYLWYVYTNKIVEVIA